MAVATYPDNSNILARIKEIQEIIVDTSLASKSPGVNIDNLPYWMNIITNVPIVPGVRRQSYWEYNIEMGLVRETYETGYFNDGVTLRIADDIVATQKEFRNRANLITPTFTDPPPQYIRDSLNILSQGYTIFPGEDNAGDLVGSQYTLTFRFMILQSQAEVDAP